MTRTWWFLPGFSIALGLACLVAFAVGGSWSDGVRALGVMSAVALVLVLGGRSETLRGLRGDGRDERFERIDRDATALAGIVLVGAVIALCLWEWAHGRDGSPYAQLGAIGGAAYLLATAFLRWRG